MWTTSTGTLGPFISFLIILNLEKALSPEQLVTIKLRNKASRGCINYKNHWSMRHHTQTRFCHFFAVYLSRWGRVLRLPVGKVALACYSSSSRSSLICLAWEQYKLAQVLNSNLISEWLYWRSFKWKKITSKNTNRALPDANADKTIV